MASEEPTTKSIAATLLLTRYCRFLDCYLKFLDQFGSTDLVWIRGNGISVLSLAHPLLDLHYPLLGACLVEILGQLHKTSTFQTASPEKVTENELSHVVCAGTT